MAKYLDADGLQHYHESIQPSLVRGVTQAEYDALSDEEKRGLVVITDAQPSGGGESGGTCEDVYSTEEQRIGTWIDGKPLYRKTVKSVGLTGSTNSWIHAYTVPTDEFVVMYESFIHSNGPDKVVFAQAYRDWAGTQTSFHYNQQTKIFQFFLSGSDFLPADAIINYYYTKTTDQPEATT